MRLSLHGANPAEWLALRAGIVPNAAAEAWGGMALSGVLIAAVRTGVTARLAEHPSTAEDLAASLGGGVRHDAGPQGQPLGWVSAVQGKPHTQK